MHATDANLAERRYDQSQAQQHEDVSCQQEEPRQIAGEPVAQCSEQRLDLGLQGKGNYHEEHCDQCRDGKDLAVQVDVEAQLVGGQVVLTDDVVGIDQIGRPLRGRHAFRGRRLLGAFVAKMVVHDMFSH